MANVLVVDDSSDILELSALMLELAGHTVQVGSNGAEGLKSLRGGQLPDCIVLDVEMPVLNGPGMAQKMVLHDAGEECVPIVLVSGRDDLPEIAARVGTPYFLTKGTSGYGTTLLTVVNRALASRTLPRLDASAEPRALRGPSSDGASPSRPRMGDPGTFARKPRLLVIDDEAHVRSAYARVLGHDFTVETEADATVALRRLTEGTRFDVILCDRNLGDGMSGKEFFDAVSLDMRRHVVVCSGMEPNIDDAFVKGLGDRFFMKPGHVGGLISLLLDVATVPASAVA